MVDEIALNRSVELAARAIALINDETLREAFETLDRSYIKAWRETDVRDSDARERLWQAVQIVAKVRDHLARLVGGGKVAQAELNEIARRRGNG